MKNVVAAPFALSLLHLPGHPLQQALGRRRQHDGVDRVVAVVGDPLAVHLLLSFETPGAPQLRGDRAGPRVDAPLVSLGGNIRFNSSASRRVAHCVSVRLRALNLSSTAAASLSLKLRFFKPFISLKPSTRAAKASHSPVVFSASNHSDGVRPRLC